MTAFDLTVPELERYEPVNYEPDDFDDFWTGTLAEAAEHDLAATFTPVDTGFTLVDTYDVTFAGYGGNPVRAWLRVPRGADGAVPVVVQYHGYNGGRGLAHDPALGRWRGSRPCRSTCAGRARATRSARPPTPPRAPIRSMRAS